jgi:hypothetical protein
MRAGFTSDLEIECRRPDSRIRTFIDAEIEVSSDVRRRRAQWMLADSVVLRTHDFPASSALTAAGQTTALTLANAPAGNDLYEVHFLVQITPVIPGAGTNTHVVEVAIDTRPAAGAWTERAAIRYEVLRTAGQNGAIVRWLHEDELIRLGGLISTSELRLRIKSASGPGGWAFVVHGYNLATNGDAVAGVNYHTGLAVDFPVDGGVALADKVKTLVENAVSDGYQQDLDGSYASAAASPFLLARMAWGKDDVRDIPLDRFVAYLNPRVDGGQPRNVHLWLMRPYAVTRLGDRATESGNAWNQTQVDPTLLSNHLDIEVTPLSSTLGVFATAGDTPEEVVFSWATKPEADKPHPKRYVPSLATPASSLDGPVTLFLIWAQQRDGTPATNVGWGQDSATAVIVSGSRTLKTVQMRILDLTGKWVLESPERGAATRACLRCRVESGDYPSTATVAFTGAGAGSRFDLGVVPTKTVQFICRADVPPGASAVFQLRNDADAAWVTVTDGQTTDDLVGITKTQTRKGQVILTSTPNLDATPLVFEFGMRELTTVPLHHGARLQSARWAVDPLQLVAETTNARIVLPRDPKNPYDRVTEFLRGYFIGQVTLRVWVGTPERPRWMHIDDFLIDDEESGDGEVGIPALGVTCLERGTLPVFDSVTESAQPLVYANKSLAFAYDDILTKIGVSGRFLGPGIQDAATLVSKILTESEAKAELDALNFLDGSARISSQGRIKSVRMFGDKAVARVFPRERIKWTSVTPGYRQRAPEVRIPWQWNDTEERYQSEHKAVNAAAVLRLGRARIDPPQLLPDVITKWIPSATLADRIGKRHVGAFGAGMMLWFFEVDTPEPQLEPGDCVAVPTDLFAGRDPMNDRPVSGEVEAIGVIAAASEDFRTFALFMRSWADITGSTEAGTRIGFAAPDISSLALSISATQQVTLTIGATASRAIRWATSTTGFPSQATTEAGTLVVLDAAGNAVIDLGALATLATMYVCVLPFENANGSGAEGMLRQAQITAQPIPATTKVIFLTSGTSWTVPGDFNAANNSIQGIGGGGGGAASRISIPIGGGGGGGGGGEYRKITNFSPGGSTVAYVVGQGGAGGSGSEGAAGADGTDTTFNVTSLVAKKGTGAPGASGGAGGTGGTGAAANFNGGAGGAGSSGGGNRGGGGGGGAGGTTGVGGAGASSVSGTGGAGGAGGTASGGAAGSAGGGNGGAGTVFTSAPGGATAGAGGGGGGGTNLQIGGAGGVDGGGGAGAGADGVSFTSGGNGRQGLIVITYTTA